MRGRSSLSPSLSFFDESCHSCRNYPWGQTSWRVWSQKCNFLRACEWGEEKRILFVSHVTRAQVKWKISFHVASAFLALLPSLSLSLSLFLSDFSSAPLAVERALAFVWLQFKWNQVTCQVGRMKSFFWPRLTICRAIWYVAKVSLCVLTRYLVLCDALVCISDRPSALLIKVHYASRAWMQLITSSCVMICTGKNFFVPISSPFHLILLLNSSNS